MSTDRGLKFGAVLKTAREEKNISMVQVSETLKLSIEKIEDIEASKAERLPPAAFTCGYLRLFSRLVEINEEEVIQLYNQSVDEVSIESALGSTSDLPTQATSDDIGMRVVSYSFVLVVVVLLIIWFQGVGSKTPVSDVDVAAIVIEEPVVVNDEVLTSVEESSSVVIVEEIKKPKPELKELVVSPLEEGVVGVLDNDLVMEESEVEKIIELAKEANPIASVGSDVVIITASDDCWVEVSDANKQLLYFSLLKKGEVVELQGQEPFNVFLGKATVIAITLNEIEYDISKHIRSNSIARFTMSMDDMLEKQVRQDVLDNSKKI